MKGNLNPRETTSCGFVSVHLSSRRPDDECLPTKCFQNFVLQGLRFRPGFNVAGQLENPPSVFRACTRRQKAYMFVPNKETKQKKIWTPLESTEQDADSETSVRLPNQSICCGGCGKGLWEVTHTCVSTACTPTIPSDPKGLVAQYDEGDETRCCR